MKICSFNLWSDAPRNARWPARRALVADVLRGVAPDLAGLQEATLAMIRDLEARLPDYRWIGAGRDDGLESGEFAPIFFRPDRFSPIEHAHFWLSAKCDKPGRGWDAAHSRIVTWGRFVDQSSGRRFVILNTHFDHLGRNARRQSARLLRQKIGEIAGAEPALLTGDFNCGESSAPYRTLTGNIPFTEATGPTRGLRDTFHDSERPPEGPRRTYLGLLGLFGLGRIDYVFVNDGFHTLRHAVIDAAPGASDHRPVLAELAFSDTAS